MSIWRYVRKRLFGRGGQYKAAPECTHDMGYVWEVSIMLLPNEVIIVIFWGGQYKAASF